MKTKDKAPEQMAEANVPQTAQPAPAVAVIPPEAKNVLTDLSINLILSNPTVFGYLQTLSQIMASGQCTVPEHLRDSPGDCMAVIMQASQWGMNPWAVAQKTFLIKGVLGYEAQLVNAVVTHSGAIQGAFDYEWFGPWENVIGKFKIIKGQNGDYQKPAWTLEDEKGCGIRVSATLINETKPRVLELLLSQATVRNSTMWASDPKQQLGYLGVKRFARLFCPGCIMGVYTADELEEIPRKEAEKNITPVGDSQTEKLLNKLQGDPVPDPVAETMAEAEVDYKLPDTQRKQIFAVLKETGINKDYFKQALAINYGIDSTNDIPLERFDEVLDWIRKGCAGEEANGSGEDLPLK